MGLFKRTLSCAATLLAQMLAVAALSAEGSTSPTLAQIPTPEPVVFEFEINRTTEPLSLFNVLPPPIPLNDVMRLRGERATSATTASLNSKNVPPIASKATPRSALSAGAAKIAAGPATSSPPGRISPAPAPRPTQPLPPPPVFREYPDSIVLTNSSPLSCKILGDLGSALRIELSNGVVVHMPKSRIAQVNGKALVK
jgi:hypothetical protein